MFRARLSLFALENRDNPDGSVPAVDPIAPPGTPPADPGIDPALVGAASGIATGAAGDPTTSTGTSGSGIPVIDPYTGAP